MSEPACPGRIVGDVEHRLNAARSMMTTDPLQAAEIVRALIAETQDSRPEVAAEGAYLLARLEMQAAELHESLAWIDRSRSWYNTAGRVIDALRTDLGRINVLNDLGRHQEAVEVGSELELRLHRAAGVDDERHRKWLIGAAAENTGASHGWLARHRLALELYDEAAAVYERLGAAEDIARLDTNRGAEHIELGECDRALEHLGRATSWFSESGDLLSLAHAQAYEAKAYALVGDYGSAIHALERADDNISNLERSQEQLRVSLVWAEVYSILNLTQQAVDRCASLIGEFESHGMVREAGLGELILAHTLWNLGNVSGARAELDKAQDRFTEAGLGLLVASCNLLRSRIGHESRALALAESALTEFIETDSRWRAAEAALVLAELSPTRHDALARLEVATGLLDGSLPTTLQWMADFIRGRWFEHDGDDREAAARYGSALSVLRELRSSIGRDPLRAPFMSTRREVQEALVSTNLRMGDVRGALRVTEDERADGLAMLVGHERPTHPTAKASRYSAVTFQTLGDKVVAFIERSGAVEVVELESTIDEITSSCRRLATQWKRFEHPELGVHTDRILTTTMSLLTRLHDMLWLPLVDLIPTDEPVLLVPTGVVAGVPFHALFDGELHLIDTYEMSMAPSASIERSLPPVRRVERTLVVGVPDDRAPQISAEVEIIADNTSGRVLLGPAATAIDVAEQAASHDVVHIAAHSKFNRDNPWFSSLLLGDGWVRAIEIAEWDLGGALVVLASCRSGEQLGAAGGDELLGLPRAFLAAGASTVVMNLWPVDDAASVGMMTQFHHRLASDPPSSALRIACAATKDVRTHPFYWAPTVLYGSRQSKVES